MGEKGEKKDEEVGQSLAAKLFSPHRKLEVSSPASDKEESDATKESLPGVPEGTVPSVNLFRLHGEIPPPGFIYGEWFCELDRVTVISAPPGVGKTWFLLAMALAMSRGVPFLGNEWPAGRPPLKVAFIDTEMGEGLMLHRLKSIMRGAGISATSIPFENLRVFCMGGKEPPFNLADHNGQSFIRTLRREYNPDVIIAEPLVNLLGPHIDENDNKAINAFVHTRLGVHDGVRWFLSHHENKGGEFDMSGRRRPLSQRTRGASSLEGAADRMLSILKRGHHGMRYLEWGKCRNWKEPPNFFFKLSGNPWDEDDPQWIRLEYVKEEKGE